MNSNKQKKLPYFPFYPSDFDSDTQLLSDAEVGAYVRLLNIQWKKGKIPANKLPRLMDDYDAIWDEISEFFVMEGGLVFNNRLEEERVIAIGRHEKAMKANNARWNAPSNAPSIPTSNPPDDPPDDPPAIPTQNSELRTNNLELIKSIVEFLNEKAETSFHSTTPATQTVIKARLHEGFSAEDIKRVIEYKVGEWKHNPEMSKYLRPLTLFGNKFESYFQASKRIISTPKDRLMRSTPE